MNKNTYNKSDQLIKQQIINKLTNKYIHNIAIVTHLSPDGDAIGSCVALALALESLNKKIDVIVPKQSNNFNLLTKHINLVKHSYKTYDLTILLDCSSLDRTIIQLEELSKYLIVIDHHVDNNPLGNLYWCENVAATTMIIYQLLIDMNVYISPAIATALYAGIIGDTAYFTNNNITAQAYHVAAELISKGADLSIINQIFLIKQFDIAKLTYSIINNAILNSKYQIIYAAVLKEDLDKYHLSYNVVDHIMKELKNIKEAKIAFLFIESTNDTKVKVRSRQYDFMNKIMQHFNGGGHKYAAGASIDSIDIYNVIDTVITHTINYINEHADEINTIKK